MKKVILRWLMFTEFVNHEIRSTAVKIKINCRMQYYYGIFVLTCLVKLHVSKPNYLII